MMNQLKHSNRCEFRRGQGRQEFVYRILNQWRAGLPIRVAAKLLRKAGIHPWSLPINATARDRNRMLGEIHLPDSLVEAIRRSVGFGLGFVNVRGPLRMPEGLLVSSITLLGCHDVVHLPRRLWASQVEAENCRRLVKLALGGGVVRHLEASRCPRLRDVSLLMAEGASVLLTDCPRLRVLPRGTRISSVTLKDLPGVRALPPSLRAVGWLSLWRLPLIRNLSGLTVNRKLVIQDCLDLQLLPQVGPEINGLVLDCPALVDQAFPNAADGLLMTPGQAARAGEAAFSVPRVQAVAQVPLVGLEEPENPMAWAWPPSGYQGSDLDCGIEQTGRALGMGPQDRIRLHVAAGMPLVSVVRGLMLLEADPVGAVHLGADLLNAFMLNRNLQGAQLVCLAAEQLGLGALSIGLSGNSHPLHSRVDLSSVLGPFWGPRVRSAGAPNLSGRPTWYDSEGTPGPLILTHWANISQNTELRWMDGPLWSAEQLWIIDCPRLERLPDLIVAQSRLTIESCPRLAAFPRRLEVQGDLTLRNLPSLWAQTCRIRVGGQVRVEGCPGLTLLPMDTP